MEDGVWVWETGTVHKGTGVLKCRRAMREGVQRGGSSVS